MFVLQSSVTYRHVKRWLKAALHSLFVFMLLFFHNLHSYRSVSFSTSRLGRPSSIHGKPPSLMPPRAAPVSSVSRFSSAATGIPKFIGDQGHGTHKASSTINNVRPANAINCSYSVLYLINFSCIPFLDANSRGCTRRERCGLFF